MSVNNPLTGTDAMTRLLWAFGVPMTGHETMATLRMAVGEAALLTVESQVQNNAVDTAAQLIRQEWQFLPGSAKTEEVTP